MQTYTHLKKQERKAKQKNAQSSKLAERKRVSLQELKLISNFYMRNKELLILLAWLTDVPFCANQRKDYQSGVCGQ